MFGNCEDVSQANRASSDAEGVGDTEFKSADGGGDECPVQFDEGKASARVVLDEAGKPLACGAPPLLFVQTVDLEEMSQRRRRASQSSMVAVRTCSPSSATLRCSHETGVCWFLHLRLAVVEIGVLDGVEVAGGAFDAEAEEVADPAYVTARAWISWRMRSSRRALGRTALSFQGKEWPPGTRRGAVGRLISRCGLAVFGQVRLR